MGVAISTGPKIDQKTGLEIVDRSTVGVYLPNKRVRESWRLLRDYARELRDMNLGNFVDRGDNFRLTFVPDLQMVLATAVPLPGAALGLDHRRLENGVRLHPPKRTKTRCERTISYSLTQCQDNNQPQANQ